MLRSIPLGDPDSLGPGQGRTAGPGRDEGRGLRDGIAGPGSGIGPAGMGGVTSPRLLRKVDPEYTDQAMHAKVQGRVALEAVVLADGSVGDVKVIRSLDPTFGLDRNAIKAVRQWRFAPGTRQGRPIPVIVSVELTFTLR